MRDCIKPIAAAAGIPIKGWHTLRHSYTTLLRQNNSNVKVVQGLLRHSSIKIIMDVYDQAMPEEKKRAHRGVVRQVKRSRLRNRSVIRSVPKLPAPQVIENVASLTTQSLNQFTENVSKADALSAVIASVHAGLANIGDFGISPESRRSSPESVPTIRSNDTADIPLQGFEHKSKA